MLGGNARNDTRIAILMFGGGAPGELVPYREAVQYGLFSIRGQYRRFVRSTLSLSEDGKLTTPAGGSFRWDPDMEEPPKSPDGKVHNGMFMPRTLKREREALAMMNEFDFESSRPPVVVPVYVENSGLLTLDRQELLRSVVHGLNGRFPFQWGLPKSPQTEERIRGILPFRDFDAFECAVTEEDALESLIGQLFEQYSLNWMNHVTLVPAQWVQVIPACSSVFVRTGEPLGVLAASPTQLRIKRGSLDLQIGSPPQPNKSR